MKKDIHIPVVTDVYVAVVREWNDEFTANEWNAYLINDSGQTLETALVVTKGYDDLKKTSLLRHNLGDIAPKSFRKIEYVQDEVLSMINTFSVTYFHNNQLFDKRFVFPKNTINERALQDLPIMEVQGVLRK
ncbi:hypothetical protein NBT05_04280 [Aquimarina sp. ERC-38]|uniref:hypothetical protein n=1 Tax=Aquimarina sp. ERC-38 TaxID=2949996 RepID=UPI0022466E24|nr:hypothetical protein [Aquimarina sp. ERC-38]UZO81692.1 hypothetical protein NBT05_04280 [Aquimarina sp. ERC-38]